MPKKIKKDVKPPYIGPVPTLTPFTEKPLPGEWLELWNGGIVSERLARAMKRQLELEGWYQNPSPHKRRRY